MPLAIAFVVLCGASLMLGNLSLLRRNRNPGASISADPLVMAISMSLAAGVMIFVSFAELFVESQHQFTADGYENPLLYSSLCLFLGSFVTALINGAVHLCGGHGHGHGHEIGPNEDMLPSDASGFNDKDGGNFAERIKNTPMYDPIQDDSFRMRELRSMGVLTSISLALHNIPEGLAVVVATLDEPSVGATLALAVALHNIPLGLSISVSMWTTDRVVWKPILVTFLVGMAQPLGGLVGYYLLDEIFSGTASSVLYGVVAGMMIYVAVKELIPLASTYDKAKKWTTPAFFLGMILVAGCMLATGEDHGH